jgi:hypothetical protein
MLRGSNIPATLNELLGLAAGNWIMVLNGDDAIFAEAVAQVLFPVHSLTAPSVICGDVSVLSIGGQPLGSRVCRIEKLERFMAVNHPAMLVSRGAFEKVGIFDASVPTAYDYVWTWKAYRAGIPFRHVSVELAQARLGGISQSRAHRAALEIYRFKVAAGAPFSAARNYATYLAKAAVREVLPSGIMSRLTGVYRMLSGSVDRY